MSDENKKAVIEKARQIAHLMDEICALAQKDKAVDALICEGYPFKRSLDEVSCEVIAWRDAMEGAA